MLNKFNSTHNIRKTAKFKSIRLLVLVSSMHYCTSTPSLSTWQSSTALIGKTSFKGGFPLRCFQRLSRPYVATQRCFWRNNWYTIGMSNSVLSYQSQLLSIFQTPTADRDRTVSRRSEPNSRTTLIGEQPNPWDLLQPQDVMSRHRGAKRFRRYELLGIISLLSPAYLLSVERWPFHAEPPDHYDRLSTLLDMYVSQSGRLMPLHSKADFRPA